MFGAVVHYGCDLIRVLMGWFAFNSDPNVKCGFVFAQMRLHPFVLRARASVCVSVCVYESECERVRVHDNEVRILAVGVNDVVVAGGCVFLFVGNPISMRCGRCVEHVDHVTPTRFVSRTEANNLFIA